MIPDPRDVILAPVISEKSYGLVDEGTYTFVVASRTPTRREIKIAVEQIFGVKVDRVNTAQPAGQAQAHPLRLRQAQGHQARAREPAPRRHHRDLRRHAGLSPH